MHTYLINHSTDISWVNPRITSSFEMRMTPGFMASDIKPDIVLISNEDDIRLFVHLKLQF